MSQKFPTKPHRSFSELQTIRKNSKNELPTVLQDPRAVSIEENEALGAAADHADIQKAFPHTYGTILPSYVNLISRISIAETAATVFTIV